MRFFLTRVIAANNRAMELRDAAEWFRRGEHQLAQGDAREAIVSFRRATARNRGEKRYVLALALALAGERQYEAARRALLTLRDASPEDPDVNLPLARLAATRQDVAEAVRYYHDTLYAPWPPDRVDARRSLRFELIDFMLSHGQTREAVSELVAFSSDMPDVAGLHVQVGRRFSKAGENRGALEQFQAALRAAPADGQALAGAGLAAFALGQYPLARRYSAGPHPTSTK